MKEVVFKSAGDALEVLTLLKALARQNGAATVADLHDLTGNQSNYKDNWQGWQNLNDAYIEEATTSEDHVLVLPQPIAIEYKN